MSSTALVRSTSSSTSLIRPQQQQRPASASPSAMIPITLPKLNLTPQSSNNPSRTQTPQQQRSADPSTPARWQHPRMDEVISRQSKTNFDNSNVRIILWNFAFLILSFFAPATLDLILSAPWTHALAPYPTYTLLALDVVFIANISTALAPLFRKPDTCEDIPLTPAQRQLLGLPPMSRPATPQEKEQYMTPPRYSRSATPRSSSSSLRNEVSGSPLSGRGTPLDPSSFRIPSPASPYGYTQQQHRRSSGTPLTPAGIRGSAERRRLSYNNRSSPLSISEFDAAGSTATPTKTNNRASVGLNSKWLYEKGRANPLGTWGTGSVFS